MTSWPQRADEGLPEEQELDLLKKVTRHHLPVWFARLSSSLRFEATSSQANRRATWPWVLIKVSARGSLPKEVHDPPGSCSLKSYHLRNIREGPEPSEL